MVDLWKDDIPNHSRSRAQYKQYSKEFQIFIKKVYQKEWKQNITKKKYQNNYFRDEIRRKEQELLRLKLKKKIDS